MVHLNKNGGEKKELNMKTKKPETMPRGLVVRINDWFGFYKIANWFIRQESTWVFRGHEDSKWELKSTWDRFVESCKKPSFKTTATRFDIALAEYFNYLVEKREDVFRKEKCMIAQFKQMIAWDHYLGDETLPYLMAMQHYGIPTRLLDFSYSLFVALYFAYEHLDVSVQESEYDRAIWAIKMDNITAGLRKYCKTDVENRKMKECNFMELAESFLTDNPKTRIKYGVVPIFHATNPRMAAQKGLFLMPYSQMSFEINLQKTIGYNPFKMHVTPNNIGVSIDEFMNIKDKSNIHILKFVFAQDMRKMARMVLEQANMDELSIYPDRGEDVSKMKCFGRSLKHSFAMNLL